MQTNCCLACKFEFVSADTLCCLKIQQQLGQKTNLPCAEVIAMFTTGLH